MSILMVVAPQSLRNRLVVLVLLGVSSFSIRPISIVQADILPHYSIPDVPDFDQKRDFLLNPFRYGLPANDPNLCSGDPIKACDNDADCGFDGPCIGTGGAMYCFPTAAIDWMAYLANNGYPQVIPGPAPDWESMDVYNLISEKIEEMGELMETTPNGGTKGEPGRAAIQQWLQPHGNLFSVVRLARSGTFCPRLEHLAKAGLGGQLVIAGVGYYDLTISRGGGVQFVRNGGHLLAFTKAEFTGNPLVRKLGFRNPSTRTFNSDTGVIIEPTTEQSPFAPQITTLTPVTFVFEGYARTQDKLSWTGRHTFLDSYTAIVPASLMSAEFVPGSPGIKLINPVPLPPTNRPLTETIPSPGGSTIVDGAFRSDFTGAFLITEGIAPDVNRLWQLEFLTGDATEIPQTGSPSLVATGRSPQGWHCVYVEGKLRCFFVDETGITSNEVPLPSGASVAAMEFVDTVDEIMVLLKPVPSLPQYEIHRYSADLASASTVQPLPSVIAPTGAVDLAVGPAGDQIWIADTEGETIYGLTSGAGGGLVVSETISCCANFGGPSTASASSLLATDRPVKIVMNGNGLVVLLDTGGLFELERDAAGAWQPSANPLFAGHAAGGFIDIVRPRTNHDPATMTGPEWRDVLPIADFDEVLPPPAAAPATHVRAKNRYVSLAPDGAEPVRYLLTRTLPAPPVEIGWVDDPDGAGMAKVRPLTDPPALRTWSESVIHVGDCEIIPDATYELRATTDNGVTLSPPLIVSTVARPLPKFWGDTVGSFSGAEWDAPNGIVNTNDFLAALQKFQNLPSAPHVTVVDVQSVSSIDPCLNRITNIADVFILIQAFQGNPYAFTTDPDLCPPCP